jgi:hypothetical protein
MDNLNRAKCLLENGASVRQTFEENMRLISNLFSANAQPIISAFFSRTQATKSTFATRKAGSLLTSASSTISLAAFSSSISRLAHGIRILSQNRDK